MAFKKWIVADWNRYRLPNSFGTLKSYRISLRRFQSLLGGAGF